MMSPQDRRRTVVRLALPAALALGAALAVGITGVPKPAAAECHHWWCDPCMYNRAQNLCLDSGDWYCECCTCRHINQ